MSSIKRKSTPRKKSPRKISRNFTIPNCWNDELDSLSIDDDKWKCNVTLMEETCPKATVYKEYFNKSATNGTRLAIKKITMSDVMEFVLRNMTENYANRDVTPLALLSSEVFKCAGVGFKKDIPTSLLAPLIKYMILEFKQQNKKIREGILERCKAFDDYHNSLWQQSKGKPLGKSIASSKFETKSNKSKKSLQLKGKLFTKLRKRGEEWMDIKWVDDAPAHGPKLYIVISSFFDAHLPLKLMSYNIPLVAIIRLSALQDPSNPCSHLKISEDNEEIIQNPYRDQIINFWESLEVLKSQPPTALMFKSVMFVDCSPFYSNCMDEVKNPEDEIYKQLSHFLYDIFETSKLHELYLNDLKLTDVSDFPFDHSKNMIIYNTILDDIPQEALTVPFLLEAMIFQVCGMNTSSQGENETQMENISAQGSTSQTPPIYFLQLLKDLNIRYDIANEKGIFNTKLNDNDKTDRNPRFVLIFSDDVNIKTFHLETVYKELVRNISIFIIKSVWYVIVENLFIYHEENTNFIRLCNEIIKVKEATGESRLYYYIYLLIVNIILNSILLDAPSVNRAKQGDPFMKNTKNELCDTCFLESSYSLISENPNLVTTSKDTYKKNEICDACLMELAGFSKSNSFLLEKKSTENTINSCNKSIFSEYSLSDEIIASNLFYIEDMSSDVLVQKLQFENHKFSNFTSRYCPFTDQIVLVFHNICSQNQKVLEENWVGSLKTHVPLRDFVDYILIEEQGWVDCNLTQPDIETFTNQNNLVLGLDNQSKIPKLFTDLQFISHRSLKYVNLTKKLSTTSPSRKSPKTNKKSKTKGTISSNSKTIDKKRKIKDTNKKDIPAMPEVLLEKKDSLSKTHRITGYDLGEPMRFQYMGYKKEKLMNDTSRFTFIRVNKLYGEQTQTLHATISGHTLYYDCKAFYNNEVPSSSFHLILTSGILLYFKYLDSERNKATVDSIFKSSDHSGPLLEENIIKDISQETFPIYKSREQNQQSIKHIDYSEIDSTYGLKISTPAGLYVEIFNENSLFYIKQHILSKGTACTDINAESFRCYMENGFIMKFLTNGKIHVLTANGTTYVVNKILDTSNNKRTGFDTDNHDRTINDSQTMRTKIKKSLKDILQNNTPIELKNARDPQKVKEENYNCNIYDYQFTTSDGRDYIFQNNKIEELDPLFMTSSVDIKGHCIHGERLDGMSSTHYSDGSLIVRYPDGSQITSIPIETDEFFCEWSTEEMSLWFAESEEEQDKCLSNDHANSVNEVVSVNDTDETAKKDLQSPTQFENLELDYNVNDLCDSCIFILFKNKKLNYSKDGFVVFNTSYLMEHPNYSSVYFNAHDYEVKLSLPFLTSISLKHDGIYTCSFEGANLLVEQDKIIFNKVNDLEITGSTTIFRQILQNIKTSKVFKICNVRKTLSNDIKKEDTNIKSSQVANNIDYVILQSLDKDGNEIYVDKFFNIYEGVANCEQSKIQGHFSCFVLNRDLSGFRLVSDDEVNKHTKQVKESQGLVKNSKLMWASTFTCTPVVQNESEKWLMKYKNTKSRYNDYRKHEVEISTYGPQGSWTHPFMLRNPTEPLFLVTENVVIRYLHRVPTEETILNHLKLALRRFKNHSTNTEPIRIVHDPAKGGLDLSELVKNPKLLNYMYEKEIMKIRKQTDKFRSNIKKKFVQTLINKACITSRNKRQKNKDNEMKAILKSKEIPPYHLSCFGQVHSVLDEILANVKTTKTPSSTSIKDRVNSIIDEILSLVNKTEIVDGQNENIELREVDKLDKRGTDNDNLRGTDIGSRRTENGPLNKADNGGMSNSNKDSISIKTFDNVGELKRVRSYKDIIDCILEKPLKLVTQEDLELLCKMFQEESPHCPIIIDEVFILEDVLDAGLTLSHYFDNLHEMLEFHRNNNDYNDYY